MGRLTLKKIKRWRLNHSKCNQCSQYKAKL